MRIAFYAPMKAPDHPTPSGDRQIARLTLRALELAGYAPVVVSDLRTLEMTGDAAAQADLHARAKAEKARLIAGLAAEPPALWFTYHCYYKAPDLLGPKVANAFDIPYVLSEPSISPRRREGPWAGFARASEAAIAAADILFWTTRRDLPALEAAGLGARLIHLPAFVDAGPAPAARPPGTPLQLLCVAMMRSGDKLESYRRLGRALARLNTDWRLEVIGDGPERPAVQAALGHEARVTYRGTLAPEEVASRMTAADLLVWPGVGEGVGMVALEAQAAGLPVITEDHPAQRDLVAGRLAPADDPAAFAAAIRQAANNRIALSRAARACILKQHDLPAAARLLKEVIDRLIGRPGTNKAPGVVV